MAQQYDNKLLTEIAKVASSKQSFFALYNGVPGIDWLGFAEKTYRLSHSVASITTYCHGIRMFVKFLQERQSMTLPQALEAIKADDTLVYKLLDGFVTWCDMSKGFMPRTTKIYFVGITRLFAYLDIEINKQKLDNKVSMPRAKSMKDEYPEIDAIRKILNACDMKMRAYLMLVIDAGFEPVDVAQLKPKYFKFDEDPARVVIDREKTDEPIETFVSKDTADAVKQLIALRKIAPNDYLFFTGEFTDNKQKNLVRAYNYAVAKAGFYKIERVGNRDYVNVEKIDGHKFGTYHLKVFKKRWFSLAVTVVPTYVAMAMLGRKQYLDEYYAQPLEKRKEFAKKILKVVRAYSSESDRQEVISKAAEILGVDASMLDETKLQAFKGLLGQFATLPADKLETIAKILQGGNTAAGTSA